MCVINESLSIKTVSVSEVLLNQNIKNKAHMKSVTVEKAYSTKSKYSLLELSLLKSCNQIQSWLICVHTSQVTSNPIIPPMYLRVYKCVCTLTAMCSCVFRIRKFFKKKKQQP